MSKLRLIFMIGLTLVVLLLLSLVFLRSGGSSSQVHLVLEDGIRASIIDQIRNDSLKIKDTKTPVVLAAPVRLGDGDLDNIDRQFNEISDSLYSVVPAPRTMNKVSMNRKGFGVKDILPEEHWLHPNEGITSLLEYARENGRSSSFGWLQLAHSVKTHEITNEISNLGGELLGYDGRFLRVRFPNNAKQLNKIATLPWVAGIGALPAERKVSAAFLSEMQESIHSELLPVFITLIVEDRDNAYRDAMSKIGVDVGRYDQNIRVYEAVVTYKQIPILLSKDFVLAIEPIGVAKVSHDSAVPAMGVDALRLVGNLAGEYSGIVGRGATVGVLDSGLNSNHVAISSLRKSICGANFVDGEDHDLWVDQNGHGTHVTGTIAGNGFHQPRFAGMAPGIEHVRFAKVLDTSGFGSFADIHRGMDFLAFPTSCLGAGWTDDKIKPLIVNMSLSGTSLAWEGRSVAPRKVDSLVWGQRQLYVVSNSNSDIHGFSNYASAKNTLAVGAAHDSGDIATFSSFGPTMDGRLIPQIVGTGVGIMSAAGNHSRDEYTSKNGTSMSSPSVAGVAALLMDGSPGHREQPALVRARLLASAIKPEAWFDSFEAFPRDNSNGPGMVQLQYGLGKVSARTSVLNRNTDEGWVSGSATSEMTNDEYAFVDIEVPEGASRLDIVLTWDEPPTDTISRAVLNDLNLWIDHAADCGEGPCGEYASESTIDNLEWVVLSKPNPGTYRLKIVPEAVYTRPPRAAIAWTVIRGDSVPELSIEPEIDLFEGGARPEHQVELLLTASSYIAAGTRLHIDCRTYEGGTCDDFYSRNNRTFRRWRHEGFVVREDGIEVEHARGTYISVGELAEGEQQRVTLNLVVEKSEEPVELFFTATSWNGKAGHTSVMFEPTDSTEERTSIASVPSNDDFQADTVLMGSEGFTEIDTLLATSEEGEPVLQSTGKRPATSIWYTWIAQESSLVGFSVNPASNWTREYVHEHTPHVDVFEGDHVSTLTRVASSTWSVQFFAVEDTTYHVRISHSHSSFPMVLQWYSGARPENDDFMQATVLEGEAGSVGGTNIAATLEPGESYGTLASSSWWRWTAPNDGIWQFSVEDAPNLVVMAFTGDQVDELRLVSGVQSTGEPAVFPARQGDEYYILLASDDAYEGGAKFAALTWQEIEDSHTWGDRFEDGFLIGGGASGSRFVTLRSDFGVEPGEPLETGIRTRWYKWIADASGDYTWTWENKHVRAATYVGESFDELTLVANQGEDSQASEFVLSTREDETYYLAFGFSSDDDRAYQTRSSNLSTRVHWGFTPSNDRIANAESMPGNSGTVTGSTSFATTETDGHVRLGHNSLWYTIKPDEMGWYKVWIEDSGAQLIVAVFGRESESGELKLITHSRSQRLEEEGTEVTFHAEAGIEYFVRLGSKTRNQSIEFTLRWGKSTVPQWLRYLGRFAGGWRDVTGRIATFGNPRDLAFDTSGRTLYVTSTQGLTLLGRDPESGLLDVVNQHIGIPAESYMAWDFHRNRLYINSNCDWWIYTPLAASELSQNQQVGRPCYHGAGDGSSPLFLGSDGNFLYRQSSGRVSFYKFDQAGKLNYEGEPVKYSESSGHIVYPTSSGDTWYVRNSGTLSTYVRRIGTGLFDQIADPMQMFDLGFAISFNDNYVMAYHRDGISNIDVVVYQPSSDLTSIEELTSETFTDLELRFCIKALARIESHTIDILCNSGAMVIDYQAESSNLVLTDYLLNEGHQPWLKRQPDRYGRLPPNYDMHHHEDPVEASPDGRHLYVTTREDGILIFERVGNPLIDPTELVASRYLRLDLIQASYDHIQFGSLSTDGDCIESDDIEIEGISYSRNM